MVMTEVFGVTVERVTTAADGSFTVTVPAGLFEVTPQPMGGSIGVAQPAEFAVAPPEPAPGPGLIVIVYSPGGTAGPSPS